MVPWCSIISLTIVILQLVNIDGSHHGGCFLSSSLQQNAYLRHSTFRYMESSTLFECATECLASPVCLSFNFDLEALTCGLNSNKSVADNTVSQQGVVYSDVSNWSKIVSGPCADVMCSSSASCHVYRLNSLSCVQATCDFDSVTLRRVSDPEYPGCEYPPERKDVTVNYTGHYVEDASVYTCNRAFKQCTQSATSNCQLTQVWKNLTIDCGRSSWHNEMAPFRVKIPCGASDSLDLVVRGTPADETYFYLSILDGGDILFHISIRFNDVSMIHKVITSTRFNSVWCSEKVYRGFPFQVDVEFDLRLELHGGDYRVFVDGKLFLLRHETKYGRKTDGIEIYGDVFLRSVEFL